jgi:hypothetical protein
MLALPLITPYLVIDSFFAKRRRIRIAEKSICVICGNKLGVESLERGNEYWREYVRRLRRSYPGARFRLVRTVWAICSHCGAAYSFRSNTLTFEPTEWKLFPDSDSGHEASSTVEQC